MLHRMSREDLDCAKLTPMVVDGNFEQLALYLVSKPMGKKFRSGFRWFE